MKKSFAFGVAALIAAGAVADPVIGNTVSIEQDALTHRVTVSYDLTGEDGIVTVCFLTNGAPFEASKHVVGDVSKVVAVGNGKKIYWQPNLDLGETNLAKYSIAARVTAWAKSSPPTYYVLNLETGHKWFYECEEQLPLGIDSDVYRTKQMVFRRIYASGSTFKMGSPVAEQKAAGDSDNDNLGCETLHNVTFQQDFYIGVFEVTQAQWLRIHGEIPNAPKWTQDAWQMQQSFTGDMLPIHNCTRNRWICGEKHANDSYLGAVDDPNHTTFMSKLRAFAGSGSMYNLPYEAWWEYACRAGTTTAFNDGRDYNANTDYSDIARYGHSSDGPIRVGSLKPNAWGLYDMHGNAAELVLDNTQTRGQTKSAEGGEAAAYYAQDATDPVGITPPATYAQVAVRGGAWSSTSAGLRSAWRQNNFWWGGKITSAGFRIACPVDKY